jgi:hypothetical protein
MNDIRGLITQLAEFRHDPLGWVMYSFRWGQGELAGESGPDVWQEQVLREIGAKLAAAWTASPEERNLIVREAVASGHGIGKMQAYDDIVPVPSGMRRWGDLSPGDLVFGADGSPTRVNACTRFRQIPMYRVTFDDDSYLDVSSGHLWMVRGRTERRRNLESWRALSTLDILKLGVKRPNGGKCTRQWEIPVQGAAQFEEREIDIHPYVMGVWLGDGTKGQPSWMKPFPEIAEKISSLGYDVHAAADGKTYRIQNISHLLVDPVFSLPSPERYIPDDYKFNTVSNRMALLQGLCDTDGEVQMSGSIGYSSTSRQLTEDVLWLARSLGCKAQMHVSIKNSWYPAPEGGRNECRDCYRLTINAPFNPFTHPARRKAYKPSAPRYLKRWIDSIEPIAVQDGMCISVDAPDGLYQSGNFIVTHNSAMVSWLILWCLSTFEDSNGVVTANTEKQLQTKTWSNLGKWFRACWYAGSMFDLTATAIVSKQEKHKLTWRIDAIPWSEQNTDAFQGLHNKKKRILLVYDEAAGIPDGIWEVSEGALSDQGTEIIWCVFGNPTRNTGRFKECFEGTEAKRWHHRQIDSRTSKLTNKVELAAQIAIYGIDSDFVKTRIRGIFPSMSAKQFISVADVDAAYGRKLELGQYSFAPKIISVDPAREGDDDMVIGLRQGLHFRILRVIPKNDNDIQMASLIANLEDSEGAAAVFIDFGYGTGIRDAGREMRRLWQLVNFAEESSDPGCLNKRAEMWKLMRDWLKLGGALPEDVALRSELIGPDTVARLDGKIQIESKDSMKHRHLKSPNRADCLAISFAYPVFAGIKPVAVTQAERDWQKILGGGQTSLIGYYT